MAQYLSYPRLAEGETLAIRETMLKHASTNPARLREMAMSSHPRAQGVPTGARVASEDQIEQIRNRVMSDIDLWVTGSTIAHSQTAAFDRALGASLYEHLSIMPADAGHETTWNFLTAVVFPDIAWARFPDLHQDRVLGRRHRNTLRRAWFRHSILGDVQAEARQPLGEDEMTGLFERPTLAMNRTLIRLLATMILESEASSRSDYTRQLTKRAIALTGSYMLDDLAPEEIRAMLEPGKASAAPRSGPKPPVVLSEELGEEAVSVESDSNDLVAQFHQAMVGQLDLIREHGHDPHRLRALVERQGGLEAARVLIGSENRDETFAYLAERNKLDVSVEALVLREDFRGLFPTDLVDLAKRRLLSAFGSGADSVRLPSVRGAPSPR